MYSLSSFWIRKYLKIYLKGNSTEARWKFLTGLFFFYLRLTNYKLINTRTRVYVLLRTSRATIMKWNSGIRNDNIECHCNPSWNIIDLTKSFSGHRSCSSLLLVRVSYYIVYKISLVQIIINNSKDCCKWKIEWNDTYFFKRKEYKLFKFRFQLMNSWNNRKDYCINRFNPFYCTWNTFYVFSRHVIFN